MVLQDTCIHINDGMCQYVKAEWGFDAYFNSHSSNKRGVCILLKNNFEYKVHKTHSDNSGNLLVLDPEQV